MSLPVLFHLFKERLSWRLQPRVPEPDLVMHSPQQTNAFDAAGHADGVLAFLYFFNALHISPLLQAGDRVLDVACGPANQLALLAGLHPQTRFVGVDASSGMLAHARRTLDASDVRNVELMHGDMSRLIPLPDGSMDCVVCTMSLHHLPDRAALDATMAEIRRVLKPGGRLYLTDFGRLKWLGTQRFFACDLQQSEQFTRDYFQSLRAAFSVEELSSAAALLGTELPRYVTALASFIVVFKSAVRRDLDEPTLERIRALYAGLSPQQQDNFRGLANWFRVSGLDLPCALP